MKDLIGKAETMMNVILLVSVVLAWACIASWNDPLAIGGRLHTALRSLPEPEQAKSVSKFLNAVDARPEHELRNRVGQVNVDQALAMHEDLATNPSAAQQTNEPRELTHARALLGKLETILADVGVTNTVTFNELHKRVAPPVKLPFADQELNPLYAVLVLALGLVGPFLYLLSLMTAIEAAIEKEDPSEGVDWLFFHPGKLGFYLGVIWLFAPAIALLATSCFVSIDRHLRIGCGSGLLVVACFALVKVWRLRESFRRKEKKSKRT